jgi:hypothetical protein
MAEMAYDGSYYGKNGKVWKSPVKKERVGGGCTISIGFPIAEMHEAVGAEAAKDVAELLNRGEQFPEAVKLLESLLGLELGSSEAAMAFVERHRDAVSTSLTPGAAHD